MAATIKVEVDGALPETKVSGFSYSIMNGMSSSGKNSGEPRSGLVSFSVQTSQKEENYKLAEWACARSNQRYKKVSVKYYDADSVKPFRTIKFENAFVVRLQEDSNGNEPVQKIDISAEKVTIGGASLDNDWDSQGLK